MHDYRFSTLAVSSSTLPNCIFSLLHLQKMRMRPNSIAFFAYLSHFHCSLIRSQDLSPNHPSHGNASWEAFAGGSLQWE